MRGLFRTGVVRGITDSQALWGEGGIGVSSNPHSFHEGFGHGERKVQVLRSCRQRRSLLQLVRRGHHGQEPQSPLRRSTEETSRSPRVTSTAAVGDVLSAATVHRVARAPSLRGRLTSKDLRVQLSAWALTITSGTTAAPGTGLSAPWSGTTRSTPPGARRTTPCPTADSTGRPARSCNASTGPSASPCPMRWSTGACPSVPNTWTSSS